MGDTAEPFGHDDVHFHPRQMRTDASVRPATEAPMLVHLAIQHEVIT